MKRFRVVKYIIFSLEIIIAFVLQNTPYLLPEVYGGKAVLLIPLALSIAMFEPPVPSVIFGAVCGLIADGGYGGTMGYYAILIAILCYITSLLVENYIRQSLLTVMLIALVGIPIILFGQFAFYYLFMGYSNPWDFFIQHYLSRMVYTLVFVPLFFGFNHFISSRLTTN